MSSISKTYQEEAPVQEIVQDLVSIIEQSRCKVASYVNQEITLMYWQIGKYILQRIDFQDKAEYGKKIVATVSQQLNRSIAIAAEHKLDKKSTTTNFGIENITQ